MLAPNETLTIREARTIEDIAALHRLLLVQGEEQAVAPVNPVKVMKRLSDALDDPDNFTMLMAIVGGHLVGYLLLQRSDYWFSDAGHLGDFGFYVLPQWRNKDIGLRLLDDARTIGELAGLPVHIDIFNPRARRRGGKVAKAAEVIGYTPIGSVVTFN